jgi:hypothetical protein
MLDSSGVDVNKFTFNSYKIKFGVGLALRL